MKKISLWSLLLSVLCTIMLTACGGGGGGGGVSVTPISPSPVTPQPTTAVLTLATTTTNTIPSNTTINGYEVTITLPAGVKVKSTNPPATDAGVVTATGQASGINTLIYGVYTEATSSLPGTVKVYVANPDGFSAGVFCTVTGSLSAGTHPTAGDFSPLTLDVANGIQDPNTSVDLTSDLSLTASVALH